MTATSSADDALFEVMEGPFSTAVGDLNGDGRPEIAISSRNLHGDRDTNAVRIHAGGSGAVLRSFEGGAGFGFRVEPAGDVDADGCPDVLITTGDVQGQTEGTVEAYSGSTGRVLIGLREVGLGDDLAAVGDANGDGHADFAATIDSSPEYGVTCISGRDGSRLWTVMKPAAAERYYPGFSAVAAIGDIDADGRADLAFAGPSPPADGSGWGCLYLLSAATGAEIRRLGDGMGKLESHESITAIADVDQDGCADLLTRAVCAGAWCARVVSGREGITLLSVTEPVANFAWSVAAVGDIDGDTVADFAVGAPPFDDSQEVGRVFLYSGRDAVRLALIEGPRDGECMFPPSFGISLGSAGDFDGDGVPDILVGEDRDFGHGSWGEADRTRVFSGAALLQRDR